jgi:hypothetical protein
MSGTARSHKQDRAAHAAARMARFRQRRRNYRHCVRIEYPEALPLALVDAGFLQQWDDTNPKAIAKAIENVLIAMCAKADYDVGVTGSGSGVV